MNSPSAGSRPAVFDLLGAGTIFVLGYTASLYIRNNFIAPQGKAWLWVPSLIGFAVAFAGSKKLNLSVTAWMAVFFTTCLIIQAAVQALFEYGFIPL